MSQAIGKVRSSRGNRCSWGGWMEGAQSMKTCCDECEEKDREIAALRMALRGIRAVAESGLAAAPHLPVEREQEPSRLAG